ncbi:glycine cleavage system protein GcvH [Entomobacter blattae]|uniref:Glycine cleavage system H protein n=1 Tax=Entomobacter blattae TaxID=2762277 RepID=A0A7H1NSZ5_9PROT|nr:glycine cleavage system protein GcvH [Entomobacter blattae]QNT78905.1 Glycine cleavage system H protein [Entomobacter blattae]
MSSLYFSKDHEWLKIEGDTALVGITPYAVEALGELVFVDMQAVGTTFSQGDSIGVVESVKAASDIYAPVDGEVIEINTELGATPNLVAEDPFNKGWLVRIKLTAPEQRSDLLDEEGYKKLTA